MEFDCNWLVVNLVFMVVKQSQGCLPDLSFASGVVDEKDNLVLVWKESSSLSPDIAVVCELLELIFSDRLVLEFMPERCLNVELKHPVFLLLEVKDNRLSVPFVVRVAFQMARFVKCDESTSIWELVVLLLGFHSAGRHHLLALNLFASLLKLESLLLHHLEIILIGVV